MVWLISYKKYSQIGSLCLVPASDCIAATAWVSAAAAEEGLIPVGRSRLDRRSGVVWSTFFPSVLYFSQLTLVHAIAVSARKKNILEVLH